MPSKLAETRRQVAIVDKQLDRKSLAEKFRDLRELCKSESYTLEVPSRSDRTPH